MHLLLVSPRFPPSSAADSQRLRLLLPHLAAHGCSAEVLAVDPVCCAVGLDTWQAEHLPAAVPIHRVSGLSRGLARLPGYGSIEARCFNTLAQTGSRLLGRNRVDAVYFSTTSFGCFRLGPLWKHRHGVPFVLDYQDPWVNDHYRRHPEITPPGGRLKYAVVDRLHRFQEPRVLRHAAGYTTVSAAYSAQLQARYSFASSIPSLVLPFPGSEDDFLHLEGISPSQLPFDPHDGLIHWVSIGRGGEDLHTALGGLFEAVARHAPIELRKLLRLHFLGTSYAPAGRGIPSIAPLAARFGLSEIVEERTDRMPLSLTLATLKAADALLVLGSNDPAYTASKLYPYLLARRPLLAVMHEQSSVVEVIQRCGGGQLVTFNGNTSTADLAERISSVWLQQETHRRTMPLDQQAFAPHTAPAQARQLVQFIRQCLEPQASLP
ncbi:MAG: glycosyltransferase [Cyanobacteriota bacterium]|nr:glycosyltransferase [Cyanobacteriota bacterium]